MVCLFYINQSCIFGVFHVIKSLQDPLEVGNNLPYRMLPHLSSYLSFPVFISSFENRPAPFTGQMSLKAAKPGFSLFYVYFVLVPSVL